MPYPRLIGLPLILAIVLAAPARAQSLDAQQMQVQLRQLQSQMEALQARLDALGAEALRTGEDRSSAVPPAAGAPLAITPDPVAAIPPPQDGRPSMAGGAGEGRALFTGSAVTVSLGGFIEDTLVGRSRFQGTDVESNWNLAAHGTAGGGMPLPNSPNYHLGEWRNTVRQSRLSLLARGEEDFAALAAYAEVDFLGHGPARGESDGVTPRLRQLYATYDGKGEGGWGESWGGGWHLLAGQAWSLLTLGRAGILPRGEQPPETIDARYVPGFSGTRAPQLRLVKDWDRRLWLGLSLESPATIVSTADPGNAFAAGYSVNYLSGSVVYDSAGPATTPRLTLDQAPDIVAKLAADTDFGHYELYGLARFFTDRVQPVGGGGKNDTSVGGGVGVGALIPLLPRTLDLQLGALAGWGIGRYGSAQLADVTVNGLTGRLTPIPAVQALVGVVAHPFDRLELYGYGGIEAARATDVMAAGGRGWGYGNSGISAEACLAEGAFAALADSCSAQAAAVRQLTAGGWFDAYRGRFGALRLGLQDSVTWTKPFGLKSVNENTVMASLRYLPF